MKFEYRRPADVTPLDEVMGVVPADVSPVPLVIVAIPVDEHDVFANLLNAGLTFDILPSVE